MGCVSPILSLGCGTMFSHRYDWVYRVVPVWCLPSCGWGVVLCVSHLIDGVLVLKFCFPYCGWGVVPSCGVSPMGVLVQKLFPSCGWCVVPRVMFPIQWMGCGQNVRTHLVDGVFGTKCLFPISDLVDGV